jgi:hypothetical protein
MREALIKLFEKPISESYKADKKVMQDVLGRKLTDKPVLCFSSNPVLAALIKLDTSPCAWETKNKLKVGFASVVRTDDSAGQEVLMDFIGMMVHTKYIPCFIGTYSDVCTQYILSTYLYKTDTHFTSQKLTIGFADNVLVLDGNTKIFPPDIPEKAELVPHNVLSSFGPHVQCSHWLPGYAAVADQPDQELHRSHAVA